MKRVQVMTETISRIFKAFHGDAKLYFQSGVLKNGSRPGPVSFEFSQNSSSQLHNQLLELYLWPKFINPSKIARTSSHRSREVKITNFFSSKKAKSVS